MSQVSLARVFVIAVVLTGFAVTPALGQGGNKDKLPNIVLVLADDLGYGDLGCYGHPIMQTPKLNAFAKQGMLFKQCYSASAVCSPSRSALLTGRTPYRNGVYTWIPAGSEVHLRNTEVTIATLLRQLGYATCHVGKWHLNGMFNSPKQPQPNDHGYDWWLATQNNAAPSHKNPTNFVRNGKAVGPMQGYSSHVIADEAIDWLKTKRDKAKPFMLSMWFHEPHLPIESDEKFQDLYPDFLKKAKDFMNDAKESKKWADLAQHHGNISQMDAAFGKLMDALQEMGLDENTIVIFTSDNGPEGNGNDGRTRGSTGGLRGRKRSVYAGGIQVPGLMRWPGKIAPGSVSTEPIIGSDVFPTLCAITGAKLPKDRVIDGVSLLPVFDGKKLERKTPMYWRCLIAPEPMKIAMRQGDWKILSNLALSKFELYNLKDDPFEKKDLAPTTHAKFEAMKETFLTLNAQIEKEGPPWWREAEKDIIKKANKK